MNLFTATDHRELVQALAAHYRHTLDADDQMVYIAKLSEIPVKYVGKAASELLDLSKWMPTIAEWKQEARRWWEEDCEQQERIDRSRRLALKEEPLTPEELREILEERAALGDVIAQMTLARISKPKLAPPAINWQEINDSFDKLHEQRLAKMTEEEREARAAFLAVLHRPQRGNANHPLRCCAGCGVSLKVLDIGYTGPAPEVQGHVILCRDCSRVYSWSRGDHSK